MRAKSSKQHCPALCIFRALLSVVMATRHQLLIAKNRKTIPHIAAVEKLAKEIQNQAPIKFIATIGYVMQIM